MIEWMLVVVMANDIESKVVRKTFPTKEACQIERQAWAEIDYKARRSDLTNLRLRHGERDPINSITKVLAKAPANTNTYCVPRPRPNFKRYGPNAG